MKYFNIKNDTGLTIYAVVMQLWSDLFLDSTTGFFTASAVSKALPLTENSVIKGLYSFIEDREVWSDGPHAVVYYVQAGGSPDLTVDFNFQTDLIDVKIDIVSPMIGNTKMQDYSNVLPSGITLGDVFVGNSSGRIDRLAIGAENDVLSVKSSAVVWSPASGGSLSADDISNTMGWASIQHGGPANNNGGDLFYHGGTYFNQLVRFGYDYQGNLLDDLSNCYLSLHQDSQVNGIPYGRLGWAKSFTLPYYASSPNQYLQVSSDGQSLGWGAGGGGLPSFSGNYHKFLQVNDNENGGQWTAIDVPVIKIFRPVRMVISDNENLADSNVGDFRAGHSTWRGINLSGNYDERILFIGQTNPVENGIWTYSANNAGMWRRQDDMLADSVLYKGALVHDLTSSSLYSFDGDSDLSHASFIVGTGSLAGWTAIT